MSTTKKRKIRFVDEEIDDDEAFCSEDEEVYGEIMESIERNRASNNGDQVGGGRNTRSNGVVEAEKLLIGTESSDDDSSRDDDDEDIEKDSVEDSSVEDDQQSDDNGSSVGGTSIDQEDRKIQKVVNFVRIMNDDGINLDQSQMGTAKDEAFDLHRMDGDKGLDIRDLISTIKDEAGFGRLKSKYHKLTKSAKKMGRPIDPPPHRLAKERLERKAAYEETKKEVSKWTHIVKQNREAEHLNFPMHQPSANDIGSSSALAAVHTPSNELELAVSEALKSNKLRDVDIVKAENERLNAMTKEERAARVAELAKMRALIFYKDQKLKRISKIKSRTYRKHHRKKFRDGSSTQDNNADEEVVEKKLYLRAQERMSLRHKKAGAWRRQMMSGDPETQGALREQHELHVALRENIPVDGEGSDTGDSSDSESTIQSDDDRVQKAKQSLADLTKEELPRPKSSLFNMKFMRTGIENSLKDVQEEIDNAISEIENLEAAPNKKAQDLNEEPRFMYRTEFTKGEDPPSISARGVGADYREEASDNLPDDGDDEPHFPSKNPWLADDESAQLSSKTRSARSSKSRSSKASNKVSCDRKLSKRDDLRTMSKNISIELSSLEALSKKVDEFCEEDVVTKFEVARNENEVSQSNQAETVAAGNGPPEADATPVLLSRSQVMQMVFANDDLKKDFEDEKKACIDEEGPKFEDTTLPGWGSSWSGPGVPEKPSDPSRIKIVRPGKEAKDRKDINIDNVIISEKKNKKFSEKYQVKTIPFGYGAKEHYERLMCMPMGKDWNAVSVHKNVTRPRVRIARGSIIPPIRMESSATKMFAKKMEERALKCPVQKRIVDSVS